jgi:4-amino-4-deoxy-L-arabinose transferase-like glycosyltransferase
MAPGASSTSRTTITLLAAVLLALAARVPGVFWGDNFPGGFRRHHVDEWTHLVNAGVLIDPKTPPRTQPYPKGLAAHVAVPILVKEKLSSRGGSPAADAQEGVVPPERTLVLLGRAWSVAYGALTIVVLYFLARRLTGSESIARIAAFLMALGGLHVSQSHFFVADVPALFWTLLGTHLLLVDLDERGSRPLALPLSAFAMGVAAGIKLSVFGLPTLVIVALLFPNRILRIAQAAAFLLCGAVIVNLGSFTPGEVTRVLKAGVSTGIAYDPADLLRIYGLELLASIGGPIVLFAALGVGAALHAAFSKAGSGRLFAVTLLILLPAALQAFAMWKRFDPFPRHLLPFFPWLVILAAASLAALADRLRARRGLVAGLFVVVFGWQAALVVDGERNYLTEPRNDAMRWIESRSNVPAGASVAWPGYETEIATRGLDATKTVEQGRPDFIVAELYFWNHFLSGTGLRESYPADYRRVFDANSAERLGAFQNVYRGTSGYTQAARFPESYVMPELRLADRILGNRSRNYLTEVVIFRRS